MTEHLDYYVYVLFRPDTGTPFYVGKGRGRRWTNHKHHVRPGRSHKDNIIARAKARGLDVPVVKIACGLTNDAAIEREIALIAAIGREPLGPLVNLTSGGEGASGISEATKDKRRANMHHLRTPTAKAKRVLARTGMPVAAETRLKISTSLKGRKQPADLVARRAVSNSVAQKGRPGRPHTEEQKMARSVRMKTLRAAHPEKWAAFTRRGVTLSEETKQRIRIAARAKGCTRG